MGIEWIERIKTLERHSVDEDGQRIITKTTFYEVCTEPCIAVKCVTSGRPRKVVIRFQDGRPDVETSWITFVDHNPTRDDLDEMFHESDEKEMDDVFDARVIKRDVYLYGDAAKRFRSFSAKEIDSHRAINKIMDDMQERFRFEQINKTLIEEMKTWLYERLAAVYGKGLPQDFTLTDENGDVLLSFGDKMFMDMQ